MKKIILAVALIAACGSANMAHAQTVPMFNWSGFYTGVNAGYGWGRVRDTVANDLVTAGVVKGPVTFTGEMNDFIGGFHGGYNYQVNNFVYGIDSSWSWTRAERSKSCNAAVPGSGTILLDVGLDCIQSEKMKAIGDVRLRIGTAFDRWHLYLAGGYAGADIHTSFIPDAGAKALGALDVSGSGWQSGWTIGAGIEHALTNNFILGLDYKYYDFGDWHHAGFGGGGFGVISSIKNNVHITDNVLQLRLSYKFNSN